MIGNNPLIIEEQTPHHPSKIKKNKILQKIAINEIISKTDGEYNKCHFNNEYLIPLYLKKKEMDELNRFYILNNNCSYFSNYINNFLLIEYQYINLMIMQIYNNIQKILSDSLHMREKGLKAISNPLNINHYLIKYINNNRT